MEVAITLIIIVSTVFIIYKGINRKSSRNKVDTENSSCGSCPSKDKCNTSNKC